jgi:hypothetical protein
VLASLVLDTFPGPAITDTTAALAINRFPRLAFLSIKHSARLSDASLREMALQLPELQSVDVSECSSLSMTGIGYLKNVASVTHTSHTGRYSSVLAPRAFLIIH